MANIALFIDGTANAGAPDNPKNTNVYELYELVSAPQKAHYIAGIGTGTQVSTGYLATLRHYSVRALELAFGQGATERIKQAYKYLATNYEAGDQVYLFGFKVESDFLHDSVINRLWKRTREDYVSHDLHRAPARLRTRTHTAPGAASCAVLLPPVRAACLATRPDEPANPYKRPSARPATSLAVLFHVTAPAR
jgi:hypothetical protein